MNVNSTQNVTVTNSQQTQSKSYSEENASFKQELNELEQSKKIQEEDAVSNSNNTNDEEVLTDAVDGLESTLKEVNTVKIPQAEDKSELELKLEQLLADKTGKAEGNNLINNEINFPDGLIPHMGTDMNFNSNGQPFSDFMQNQEGNKLSFSEKDLQEERAILSSMEENIAMVNKARVSALSSENTFNESFNNIIMNKADVDFFVDLVKNGEIDLSTIKNPEKVSQVSKTLADLLTKCMNEKKPVRIDFDNDISVIIRISKDGKISADFLPSSQVAEAYLKENLPLLKQRFEENNIEYNELNQRKQQKQNEKDNRKKGRENE